MESGFHEMRESHIRSILRSHEPHEFLQLPTQYVNMIEYNLMDNRMYVEDFDVITFNSLEQSKFHRLHAKCCHVIRFNPDRDIELDFLYTHAYAIQNMSNHTIKIKELRHFRTCDYNWKHIPQLLLNEDYFNAIHLLKKLSVSEKGTLWDIEIPPNQVRVL